MTYEDNMEPSESSNTLGLVTANGKEESDLNKCPAQTEYFGGFISMYRNLITEECAKLLSGNLDVSPAMQKMLLGELKFLGSCKSE
jgi:hypothetical protein